MQSRKFIASFVVLPLLLAIAGCQEKEGPAERAGKELDKAASTLGEHMESAAESIKGVVAPAK